MARMRSGDRVHVFELLSDLQEIQSSSRNKILQPLPAASHSAGTWFVYIGRPMTGDGGE